VFLQMQMEDGKGRCSREPGSWRRWGRIETPFWGSLKNRATWQHLVSQIVLIQWGLGPDWLVVEATFFNLNAWDGCVLPVASCEWMLCSIQMKTKTDTEKLVNCFLLSIMNWLIGGKIHNPQLIGWPGSLLDLLIWVG
jgi:hypothetical protein